MSNICNAKKYVVPKTDANHDVISRSTINRKRGAKQNAWEDTTVDLVKSKRRRMMNNNHSTPSSNRREGAHDMLLDPALVSPIPVASNDNNESMCERSNNSSLSFGHSISPAGARTNFSDNLLLLRISLHENRRNDSSMELAIGFLCLEEAASRRGLFNPRPTRRMEWLNIEGLADDLMREINIQEWSTGSIEVPDTTPLGNDDLNNPTSVREDVRNDQFHNNSVNNIGWEIEENIVHVQAKAMFDIDNGEETGNIMPMGAGGIADIGPAPVMEDDLNNRADEMADIGHVPVMDDELNNQASVMADIGHAPNNQAGEMADISHDTVMDDNSKNQAEGNLPLGAPVPAVSTYSHEHKPTMDSPRTPRENYPLMLTVAPN